MRELEAVAHNGAIFQGTNLEREVIFRRRRGATNFERYYVAVRNLLDK